MHCRIFCSISGLYPLDTRSKAFNNQKCLQILPNIPWRAKSPLNGSHRLTGGRYIGFLGREAFQRTAFMEALSWGWANHAQENGKMLLVGMGRALHLGSYIQGSLQTRPSVPQTWGGVGIGIIELSARTTHWWSSLHELLAGLTWEGGEKAGREGKKCLVVGWFDVYFKYLEWYLYIRFLHLLVTKFLYLLIYIFTSSWNKEKKVTISGLISHDY